MTTLSFRGSGYEPQQLGNWPANNAPHLVFLAFPVSGECPRTSQGYIESKSLPWCTVFTRVRVFVLFSFLSFPPAIPAANQLFHPRRDFSWRCPARRSCFTASCRFLFSRGHAHIETGLVPLLVLLPRPLVSYQPPGLRMAL